MTGICRIAVDMQRAQWDSDGPSEGRWHTGNGFGGLEQATQARHKIIEIAMEGIISL